jgi:hypothetical protein
MPDTIIIQPDTKEKIENALNLMGSYIIYIKEKDRCLHFEADGTPSCEKTVQEAQQAFYYDTGHRK